MKKIKCPQCAGPSLWDPSNSSRPFCSDRCKLIDLGAWASEEYKIPQQPSDEFDDDYSGSDVINSNSQLTSTMH
ncbi:DNA gyrase inhibitor YacG [Neptunomonas antarctica]|uniref:DNA gyrase inhibitor YacG n=1 Tax=Neptunomonas antarctica TaxID=619304 RepID=A0A1N7NL42_9GAMM|nr:DNA gyrase inhibitor YacG [Neptunomonas antarctica]SIS98899.1 hypothetical protein SAMN05421760_1106 [Neptunomonas antarctica]